MALQNAFGDLNLEVTQQMIVSALNTIHSTLATQSTEQASAAKQDTGNTTLSAINTKTPALVSGSVPVTLPTAQVTALTPPAAITGFATSTKQDTLATKLDTINAQYAALATSSKQDTQTAALGVLHNDNLTLATRSKQDTIITALGSLATSSGQSGNSTKLDALHTDLVAVNADMDALVARTPVLGQATSASSTPVVLPADQITALTPIAGGASDAVLQNLVDIGQTLRDAMEYLGVLGAARDSSGQLRVMIGNGNPSTVTTVNTVGNMGAIGSLSASSTIPSLTNANAIQSNIQNVILT
jgi:outer membrane murein-binding lipoprotein Lpp